MRPGDAGSDGEASEERCCQVSGNFVRSLKCKVIHFIIMWDKEKHQILTFKKHETRDDLAFFCLKIVQINFNPLTNRCSFS